MKTSTAFAIVAATLVLAPHATQAKQSFLNGLPNGSGFPKSLGHSGGGLSPFGKMFSGSWSASLCKSTFPGSSMSVGQAFGDPCCTWRQGGKADFSVSYGADFPAQSTNKCASGGGGGGGGGGQTDGNATVQPPSGGGNNDTPASGSDTKQHKKHKKSKKSKKSNSGGEGNGDSEDKGDRFLRGN